MRRRRRSTYTPGASTRELATDEQQLLVSGNHVIPGTRPLSSPAGVAVTTPGKCRDHQPTSPEMAGFQRRDHQRKSQSQRPMSAAKPAASICLDVPPGATRSRSTTSYGQSLLKSRPTDTGSVDHGHTRAVAGAVSRNPPARVCTHRPVKARP